MKRRIIHPKDYKNPLRLFEIVINNLIVRNRVNEYLSHSQVANIVFNNGDSIHQSYLSRVTNKFGDYMIRSKGFYKFNVVLIKQHFPDFFDSNNPKLNSIDEIRLAIKHEKEASFRKRMGRIIYISKNECVGENAQYFFYNLYLKLDSDDTMKIYEGMRVKLALDREKYFLTALAFNEDNNMLTVQYNSNLEIKLKNASKKRIIIDAVWILDKLNECLIDYPMKKNPVGKLFYSNWKPKSIETNLEFYSGVLDETQKKSLQKCLSNDITAIWGPPGTGKSTTIGYLLLELFKRQEKTLVCSIANVAVDSILKNCLSAFRKYETTEKPIDYRGGKVLRIGYSSDDSINDNNDIKLESNETRTANNKLRRIKKKLQDINLNVIDKIELTSTRLDLLGKLELEKKRIIEKSSIIFATASKIEIDNVLRNINIDNVIIDEASMMSAPHLLAVAKNANKRIIIAGDFRQLGPIAISQSSMSYKWLHKDLFSFFGIDHTISNFYHPCLTMITNQRRFHESICKLINRPFYDSQLKTKTLNKNLKLYQKAPHKEKIILYYDLANNEDYLTLRTKEQSRINQFSINYVINKIIKPLQKHSLRSKFSIAIITPYRGQVNGYKMELKKEISNQDFLARIKYGTVHSFQGSEADLIIFDMVDSKNEKIGRLFWQNTGERLINVTISRATGKLIFVGDIKTITEGSGYMNVSSNVKNVLKAIELNRVEN